MLPEQLSLLRFAWGQPSALELERSCAPFYNLYICMLYVYLLSIFFLLHIQLILYSLSFSPGLISLAQTFTKETSIMCIQLYYKLNQFGVLA